jgi:hypothetical protein
VSLRRRLALIVALAALCWAVPVSLLLLIW